MAIALAPAAVEAAPVVAEAAGGGAEAAGGARAASGAKKAPAKKSPSKKVETPEPKSPKTSESKKSSTEPADFFGGSGGSKKKGSSTSKKLVGKVAGKNMLIAEIVVCLVVLLLGTIVAPSGSKDGITRMMIKGSALMAVFFILAIMSAGGKGPRKVAAALGLLITASYLLTSSDMNNIFNWIASYFKKPGTAKATISTAVSEGGTPEGSVNSDGTYTSTNGFTY